jgi:hypothetical protein
MAPEANDNHTPSGRPATTEAADSAAAEAALGRADSKHGVDDLFQLLVHARGVLPDTKAKEDIETVLRRGVLQLDFHIRGGARSTRLIRQPTPEELRELEELGRKLKHRKASEREIRETMDGATAFLYEHAPPEGITRHVHRESWDHGQVFSLTIENGRLSIRSNCAFDYPWDAYSFTIVNWWMVNELWPPKPPQPSSEHRLYAPASPTPVTPTPVATEPSSLQTASAAEPSAPMPEPVPNTESPLPEPVATRAESRPRPELTENELTEKKLTGKDTEIIEVLKRVRFPDGDVPPDITQAELIRSKFIPSNTTPGKLKHLIDDRYKEDAKAKSKATGRRETPRDPPSWPTCKRLLIKFNRLLPKQRST